MSNVSHTPSADTFDVFATGLSESEWNVAINFQSGTRSEIIDILLKQQTTDDKFKRFPLIWYIYNDDRDSEIPVIDFEATINLAFAYKQNIISGNDKTESIIENNISPIIQPLITLFKLWIQSTTFNYMFDFGGRGKPLNQNTRNFPIYGTTDGKKNVLETASSAIEFEISLRFKKQFIN